MLLIHSLANRLVSEHHAPGWYDLGIDERFKTVYVLTAQASLFSRDIARAHDVAGHHPGVHVFTADDYLPDYALARVTVTVASLIVTLAIVAVAVALVASESRRSRQILVAVGAGSMSHRKLLAATSSLLALIGGVLAIPAGWSRYTCCGPPRANPTFPS